MQQLAREEDDLVLLRNNRLIAPLADVAAVFQPRIVNTQLTAFELARLAMKEVNERQMA